MRIGGVYLESEIKCSTSVEAKQRLSSKIIRAFMQIYFETKGSQKKNPIFTHKTELYITDICCNASLHHSKPRKIIGACETLLTHNILHQVEL